MNDDQSEPPRRSHARRAGRGDTRYALLMAAAQLLSDGRALAMRAIAEAAGVRRSTLYRHFDTLGDLQQALQKQALTEARAAIESSVSDRRRPLAELRSVVTRLVQTGAQWPIDLPIGPPAEQAVAETVEPLRPLTVRLADAANLTPPRDPWLGVAAGDFLEVCLRAGWRQPHDTDTTAERLLRAITDPLDRGLLLVDAAGSVVACNGEAGVALASPDAVVPGQRAVVRDGGLYEDGLPASADTHPVSVALATGQAQEGVRGRPSSDGDVRWYTIEVHPLRRAPRGELYGFVAVFTDVTEQKRFELAQLRPAGQLRATAPPLLDIVPVLDEIAPPLLPEQLVAEAMRVTGGPVALYVVDIDGSHLLRLAGREDFPERLTAPLARVGSLGEAARRAVGKPKPEPPKRRGRRLAMLLIGAAVLALVRDMHHRQQLAGSTEQQLGS